MAAGTVVGMGRGTRAGGWIKVDHGSGVETVYVHVRKIYVTHGQAVRRGQRIGRIEGPVGNAVEAQLHLEFKLDGTSVDPVPHIMKASSPELRSAWKRAVAAIPVREENRRRLLGRTGAGESG